MVGKFIKQQGGDADDASVSAENKGMSIYDNLKSQREHGFLFLIDGYEELNLMANLYILNKLEDWEERVKVIITCQGRALVNTPNYTSYFKPEFQDPAKNILLEYRIPDLTAF